MYVEYWKVGVKQVNKQLINRLWNGGHGSNWNQKAISTRLRREVCDTRVKKACQLRPPPINASGTHAESRWDNQGAAHPMERNSDILLIDASAVLPPGIDAEIQLPDINPQLDEGAFERGWSDPQRATPPELGVARCPSRRGFTMPATHVRGVGVPKRCWSA
ncbi:hypothetical protein BD779DRAFT_1473566 [Infundibulicybe gibba]|nr:hypothetical protein BD779DRAFT_1473566 [Infundibulicybe gibba]